MRKSKDPASMRRQALAVALSVSFFAAGPAFADGAKSPDAAHLRTASEQFDAGVSAYKHKDYEGAATHFEAADAAVPTPKALRQAMRARAEGGQGAQAATLAEQALARYGDDEATAKLARETLEKLQPLLQKVRVSCGAPCVITVGTRAVPGEASADWVVYLDPGAASVVATFPDAGGAASPPKTIDAKAGGDVEVSLALKKKKKAPPPPTEEIKPTETSKAELPPEEPKPEEPKAQPAKGISPGFFVVGLVTTVGLGATMIWSGVDTQNNPGAAAVMAQCAGKGPSCPLYQEGLSKQTRTNALVGATAGVGAVTVVLAVFTRWHGSKKAVEPTAIVVDRGGALGAAGVF
jgi:hypothetical protein